MNCPFCKEPDFDAYGLKRHLMRGDCEPFENVEAVEQDRVRGKDYVAPKEPAPAGKKRVNNTPISWCQRKIMEQLPDDNKWYDLMPEWNSKTAIHFGPCAKSTVIRGLISRGLIEHRPDPSKRGSPIAHLAWITDGQIRRVKQP